MRTASTVVARAALKPLPSEAMERIASHVDRIVRGANPGSLPVEQPTKFDLKLNLKTAQLLGIAVPRPLLLRATEVIR